jgi:hypothetical protein
MVYSNITIPEAAAVVVRVPGPDANPKEGVMLNKVKFVGVWELSRKTPPEEPIISANQLPKKSSLEPLN